MIVSQADLELVLNPRIRRRVVHLPVAYGTFGERKRCSVKLGGNYTMSAGRVRDRHIELAQRQPTRARAVLDFIERCAVPARTVRVTVSQTPEMATVEGVLVWVVHFLLGDQVVTDPATFLKRGGGYTTVRDEIDAGEVLLLPRGAEMARVAALAKRQAPKREGLSQMRSGAETLRSAMLTMKQHTRLKLIEKEQAKLAAEIGVIPGAKVLPSVAPSANGRAAKGRPPAERPTQAGTPEGVAA